MHDLHVWTITSGMVAMSGHAVVDEESWGETTLREVRRLLHDRFGIDHSTVQLKGRDVRLRSGAGLSTEGAHGTRSTTAAGGQVNAVLRKLAIHDGIDFDELHTRSNV